MALKIEFVVQAFYRVKRGVLLPSEPIVKTTKPAAISLAERLAATLPGVIVLEQHVDRSADVYNEPTIVWHTGDIPTEILDALSLADPADAAAAAA